MSRDRTVEWLAALEARLLQTVTFPEMRRAVQAISTSYVERRERLTRHVTSGAGKRAAFAFYYGGLHFLIVRELVRALKLDTQPIQRIIDLGCGTGVASAAWAQEFAVRPRILAVDTDPWAIAEARWNFHFFGLSATCRIGRVEKQSEYASGDALLAAFTVNELNEHSRNALLESLLHQARRGAAVLVIEPIAGRVVPWWAEWEERFRTVGGNSEKWRFRTALPERLALMDKAAGLRHDELTCRTLWIPPGLAIDG